MTSLEEEDVEKLIKEVIEEVDIPIPIRGCQGPECKSIETMWYSISKDEIVYNPKITAIPFKFMSMARYKPGLSLREYVKILLLHEYEHAKQREQVLALKDWASKETKKGKMDNFFAFLAFHATCEFFALDPFVEISKGITRKTKKEVTRSREDIYFIPLSFTPEEIKQRFHIYSLVLIGIRDCYKQFEGVPPTIQSFKGLAQCIYTELANKYPKQLLEEKEKEKEEEEIKTIHKEPIKVDERKVTEYKREIERRMEKDVPKTLIEKWERL